MKPYTYALIGMLALQPLIATPALAVQKIVPVYKEISSFSDKPISAARLEKAFKTCTNARGWSFARVKPGKLVGKLNVRGKHYVEILVEYSSKAYKISYQNSQNMKYNAKQNTIHKRYNSWVKNVSDDVIFCLR